jgi:hypothetical protein
MENRRSNKRGMSDFLNGKLILEMVQEVPMKEKKSLIL